MQNLTTDQLMKELLAETLDTNGAGFTLKKMLGTVELRRNGNGEPLPETDASARTNVEMNAAAVRLLSERIPSLKITYPRTVLSETAVVGQNDITYYTMMRTDAIIEVPEDFAQIHCGSAFQKLMNEEWSAQLADLTGQIAARLKKHELRTNRLFGKEDAKAAEVKFCVTAENIETDIWCIPLRRCGLYPLQWDGEICGMALLLKERLKEPLAEICGEVLEIAAARDNDQKLCTVTVYYSIKQD